MPVQWMAVLLLIVASTRGFAEPAFAAWTVAAARAADQAAVRQAEARTDFELAVRALENALAAQHAEEQKHIDLLREGPSEMPRKLRRSMRSIFKRTEEVRDQVETVRTLIDEVNRSAAGAERKRKDAASATKEVVARQAAADAESAALKVARAADKIREQVAVLKAAWLVPALPAGTHAAASVSEVGLGRE